MPSNVKPLELVQLLLMRNKSKDEFLDFQKRFQSFINQSPSFLHSVGKPGFFPSFFFGMFATVLDTELATKIGIKKLHFRFDDNRTLKIAILTNEGLKCITMSDQVDGNMHLKFSQGELEKIAQKWKMGAEFDKLEKEEHEITITGKEVKYGKVDPAFSKKTDYSQKGFTEIEKDRDQQDLESLISKLSNQDFEEVKKNARRMFNYITNVYKKYEKETLFSGKESSHHGFLAGFLINFKYRFHLKLYLELFAGKGYADIILLVRGSDKSLSSIPIIIELKAGTGEISTVIKALKQAQDYVKGSFSNSIRMITIANEAICVGLNFDMVHHENVKIDVENFLSREGNSVIEKLLGTEAANAEVIRTQLEYLYYGIVWSNGGSDNINYVSRMILGQLVLISNIIKREKLGKHIFIYDQNDKMVTGSQKRPEAAKESIEDCVTTIVLTLGKKVLILNINEKNEFALRVPDNKGIPIENIRRIQNVNDIKIQEITCNLYSTPSNKNPFDQYCNKNKGITVNTYDSLDKYKRGKEILQGNFTRIVENKKFKAALSKAIESGKYDDYKKLFEEISHILHPFKSLISNEATFQAVLHGLFSSYGEDNIKVITEFQIGGGEKLDVILVINATDQKKEYPPVGIELKFAKKGELDKKEKDAKDQLKRYKEGEAYKVITDAGKVKLIYAVFNKGATDEGSLIKIGNEFVEVDVRHSSVVAFGQQPGSLQQPYVKQAGLSRAVNQ
ncbi:MULTISPECIES: hypothetical protein [Wolbachia]|nr:MULTISPECIES: hypothetical protein [Wolbachia]MBS9531160.1 hypothetical protein [Wolbachia endosymbiont of Rhagoletis cerasi]PBQ26542.1 hypothetical protein BTO27_04540 [Wolbachia pipientis wAus]QEK90053.1 hypothetical protein CAI20_05355 [Wolbachia endosymbiont of Chrysomya megacephala]QEK90103.1 hypothetical protein CAI20_05660 [Wolbachia endosymbiont of Chrysomya megacephala]UFO00742.1 hypothetical protein LOK48_02040 [Wolbachia endosymbiont of Corcyra cephalonica]